VKETQEGNFKPGQEVFGVKNDGVGLTDFRFTKDKIGEANLQRLQEIIEKIKAGEIKFN
jgi:basic membrane protein A